MAEAAGQITRIMLKQHAFINKLLSKFEKASPKKLSLAKDLFLEMRAGMEKHFSVEESNIFNVTNLNDIEERSLMNNLLKDHRDMRSILNNLAEELLSGTVPDAHVYRQILLGHEKREVEIFYPRLDKRLSESSKKEIISKIGDIKLI